jgi:hypothetical protein
MATKIIVPCASEFLWKKKCMKVPRFLGRNYFWLKPVIFRQQVGLSTWLKYRTTQSSSFVVSSLVCSQIWKTIPHKLAIYRSFISGTLTIQKKISI